MSIVTSKIGGVELPCIRQTDPEHWHVDLKAVNRIWLGQAGVKTIDIVSDCTACMPGKYWSHRIIGDRRGAQAAVIVMR